MAPFPGTYLWLEHTRHQVKRQVKRQIIAGVEKKDLVLLKFTVEETKTKLDWKHSMEFSYQNSMYDIVERRQVGDTIYFWCWWDYEETQLNKQLKRLVTSTLSQNPQNKEHQQKLHNFIKNLYHENPSEGLHRPFTYQQPKRSFLSVHYASIDPAPPAPPPRPAQFHI